MPHSQLTQPVDERDHVQGAPGAPIMLVQYGDYECPYTRLSRPSVHALQAEFGERLRFVFRNFPLEAIHPYARAAAAAAEAAAAQGRFWAMHEHQFGHQHALADPDLRRYAAQLGLDLDRFDRDRRSPAVAERIERDLASGERSGVRGTPTFFVNGARHDGPFDLDSLRRAVEAVLP
jgi:protein-disulfide isomerase